jgi:hypothetical protein
LRCLLEEAAAHALAIGDLDATIGAALAGIRPHSEGKGKRGNPGAGGRRLNALAQQAIAQGKEPPHDLNDAPGNRTLMRNYRTNLTAFASVVISRAGAIRRDKEQLSTYLATCGLTSVGEAQVSRGVASPADRALVESPVRRPPSSGELRQSLERVRAACERDGRAVYTPDLLMALLDMPGGRVGVCFDVVQMDLSLDVRAWLTRLRERLSGSAAPFQFRDWAEYPEIRQAETLAYEDKADHVTEVHLLLTILAGPSSTVAHLSPSFPWGRLAGVKMGRVARRRRCVSETFELASQSGVGAPT